MRTFLAFLDSSIATESSLTSAAAMEMSVAEEVDSALGSSGTLLGSSAHLQGTAALAIGEAAAAEVELLSTIVEFEFIVIGDLVENLE